MKLSVSIPDQLWERARSVRPDLNPSRLVQGALESWAEPRTSPGFSTERPEGADAEFDGARDHLAAQAREEFVKGYRAALALAQELPWWWIQGLAGDLFDVRVWAEGIGRSALEADLGRVPKDWGPERGAFKALVRAVGSLVGSPFGDEQFGPSLPYVRGFAAAMRRLWEEVVEGLGPTEPSRRRRAPGRTSRRTPRDAGSAQTDWCLPRCRSRRGRIGQTEHRRECEAAARTEGRSEPN